jgi:hypothetical protein
MPLSQGTRHHSTNVSSTSGVHMPLSQETRHHGEAVTGLAEDQHTHMYTVEEEHTEFCGTAHLCLFFCSTPQTRMITLA